MIFLPVQCRMARAALGLGVRELAARAKVSIDTVARFERGDQLKERTIDAIRHALEVAGVEFTNGDRPGVRLTSTPSTEGASNSKRATTGGGPGVRLKKPHKSAPKANFTRDHLVRSIRRLGCACCFGPPAEPQASSLIREFTKRNQFRLNRARGECGSKRRASSSVEEKQMSEAVPSRIACESATATR